MISFQAIYTYKWIGEGMRVTAEERETIETSRREFCFLLPFQTYVRVGWGGVAVAITGI